jgi:hypothetical protein
VEENKKIEEIIDNNNNLEDENDVLINRFDYQILRVQRSIRDILE